MADEEDVLDEEEEGDLQGVKSGKGLSSILQERPVAPPKYEVRPGLGEKFQAENIREIILTTMQDQLQGRQYRADQAPKWAKSISNAVRQRVQDLDMKRYKVLVQTTILEMKGAGLKCGQRCIWDPETDAYVDDSYTNATIYCFTIVYGIYIY